MCTNTEERLQVVELQTQDLGSIGGVISGLNHRSASTTFQRRTVSTKFIIVNIGNLQDECSKNYLKVFDFGDIRRSPFEQNFQVPKSHVWSSDAKKQKLDEVEPFRKKSVIQPEKL